MYFSLEFFLKNRYTFLFILSVDLILRFIFLVFAIIYITRSDNDYGGSYRQRQDFDDSYKIVCYYNFPNNETDLQPEEIPPDLCTHINVAFAGINQTDFSIHVPPENLQIITRLTTHKAINKNLKIIISVGGGGNNDFSEMVKNHANRKLFINSTMRFIWNYNLDGVDIDWEWPNRNGDTKEKVKFTQLLQEIRSEFNRHRKYYILSAAVGALRSQIEMFYYAHYIPKYVDYINLMTYDYHFYTSYYPITDYNAPLYASEKDSDSMFYDLNINYSVNYWKTKAMPSRKIIMGLPAFGHTYKLISSLNHDLHAPANGFGSIGENGFISYAATCDFLRLSDTFKVVDDDSKVPYAYNQYDWISYDDEASIRTKTEYIMKQQLGGAMVYSLNTEDFEGKCRKDKIKFPLITTVKNLFNGQQ